MVNKFIPKFHPRYELKDWLRKEFDYFDREKSQRAIRQIQNNSEEIMGSVREVLEAVNNYSGELIKDYYKNDLTSIKEAYDEKDYAKFAERLESLVCAIEYE
ncbi:hypothetical protein HZA97_04475 [Candidatus Woesearchaeota archaeon]|nr:hypothetical protein [Candidatus Woesearchaeota archaeon]